jgi:hypothetical protein
LILLRLRHYDIDYAIDYAIIIDAITPHYAIAIITPLLRHYAIIIDIIITLIIDAITHYRDILDTLHTFMTAIQTECMSGGTECIRNTR